MISEEAFLGSQPSTSGGGNIGLGRRFVRLGGAELKGVPHNEVGIDEPHGPEGKPSGGGAATVSFGGVGNAPKSRQAARNGSLSKLAPATMAECEVGLTEWLLRIVLNGVPLNDDGCDGCREDGTRAPKVPKGGGTGIETSGGAGKTALLLGRAAKGKRRKSAAAATEVLRTTDEPALNMLLRLVKPAPGTESLRDDALRLDTGVQASLVAGIAAKAVGGRIGGAVCAGGNTGAAAFATPCASGSTRKSG
mmetsp:Transcript_127342/g.330181  ORF Transcript_127342/g.330181 Transcript_127342/m.330181 type:complete len:250 (-) Transcript_127342:266-1015(-)